MKAIHNPGYLFYSFEDCCVWRHKDKNLKAIHNYLNGERLLSIVSPVDPNTLYLKTTYPAIKKRSKLNNFNEVWELLKRGSEVIIYSKPNINDINGLGNPKNITSSFKIVEFCLPCTFTENNLKGLAAPGDVYIITDTRLCLTSQR